MPRPQALTPLTFHKRLGTEAPPAAVVLVGTERWFRQRGARAAVRAVLPEGDPGGALVRLDGRRPEDHPRIRQVEDELSATSLFAPRRVVVVDEPDLARAPRPGKPRLSTELVKRAFALKADAILVLCIDRPLKGRNALSPTALLKAGAWVVDCRRLYAAPGPWERGVAPHDHELSRFLVSRMRALHQRALPLEVAHALTLRVGTDLGPLHDALAQLAQALPDRAPTIDDIEAAFGSSREDPLWSIADAVFAGNRAEALDKTVQAFDHGVRDEKGTLVVRPDALFLRLNRTLQRQVVQILAGHEALSRGERESDIVKAAAVPSFLAESFLRKCRQPPQAPAAMHRACFDAELNVKSGRVPARLAAERLVVDLLGG